MQAARSVIKKSYYNSIVRVCKVISTACNFTENSLLRLKIQCIQPLNHNHQKPAFISPAADHHRHFRLLNRKSRIVTRMIDQKADPAGGCGFSRRHAAQCTGEFTHLPTERP
jgi:hypothetical protein